MTRDDLVQTVIDQNDGAMSKAAAERLVQAVLGKIAAGLVKGEEVRLHGFGTFKVKDRAERKGKNPLTGEEIIIPAKKAVTFKPAKPLQDSVN